MSAQRQPEQVSLGPTANAAFVAVVVAAYVSLLAGIAEIEAPKLAVLVVLGLIFTGFGLLGADLCARVSSRFGLIAYFALEILLGGTIVYLGRTGLISLLLFPIAAQAATCLGRLPLLAVCTGVLAAMVLPPAQTGSVGMVVQAVLSSTAGLVFVVVFTQLAVREIRGRTEVQRLADELSEANRRLREYAGQVEELAAARERNRMAREIHDTLGHYLTALNMQLEAARVLLASDPEKAADGLNKALALTREGLTDVRRSVAALRAGPTDSAPLSETLAGLVKESTASGVDTRLVVTGQPRILSPAAELTLYRAVQEGLTNVRKHAGASLTTVELIYEPGGGAQLTVTDNGRGATPGELGFGLVGVRERVALLGGQVATRSAPEQGFVLDISLPPQEATGQ